MSELDKLEASLRGNLIPILEWQYFADGDYRSRDEAETAMRFKRRRDEALQRILDAIA